MKRITAKELADLLKLTGSTRDRTRKVLSTLTPREEKVLRLHFGIGERESFGRKTPRTPAA